MPTPKKRFPRRRRPATIGRALLEQKTQEYGGVMASIKTLKTMYGVSVGRKTFYNWLAGWGAPCGNPSISDCGTYIKPPLRGHINHWLGITDDSWWWSLLESKHLNHREPEDPFDALGLRPPA